VAPTRFDVTSGARLTLARALGTLSSLVALALAGLAAVAVNDLAHGKVGLGVFLLVAALVVRWILTSGLEEWGDAAAARLRAGWRSTVLTHLRVPRREGERARGDLSLAIEHAAEGPSLERLRASAASSLLGVFVIFWAAGWLGLLITLGLLAVAAPLYWRAGRRSEVMAQEYQARRALLESRQLEILQHAPELRALGAVTYGANEIAAISDSEHTLALRAIRVALESSLVTEFLSGVSVGLVAMVVGFGLLEGHLSLVRALAAVLVTAELFSQVRRYGVEFHRREDADRALETLDAVAHYVSGTTNELLVADDLVTDAHPESVSLRLRSGDRVTVTGPSGIGKTTLLHTLVGWRPPLQGSSHLGSQSVGYVSVESALLSGPLRSNLTLGADISDEIVTERLHSLGLTGARFDDLDAELLSDGRGLSSGERVRLILARALLAEVSVLVLDDVAGVLDAGVREQVRRALACEEDLAIIEATVDTPLLATPSRRIELRP
jgi:ABC-type transport system involved in cytochrome bd biosynthesis fused ATPase/permease subunit